MPRKPSDSAYILALTLRKVWTEFQDKNEAVREYNRRLAEIRKDFAKENLPMFISDYPETECVFWRSVVEELEGMKDLSEGLAMVTDVDYRCVISDAIKQPYNKVRKSKGFQLLVPVLETLRRYGPIDENQPMDMTEEEARDFADLVWQQEMQPFIDAGRGVDPINKQIIAKKVATELRQFNIKYIGEEILNVEFNDAELSLYSGDHNEALAILKVGIDTAFDLFNYNPAADDNKNFVFVRQTIHLYNVMFEKEMDDERLDDLTHSIIHFFKYAQRLIE